MDEVVNLVAKKVNLPEDKAREAVNTVIGFLKDKLPAPLASHLDGVLHTGGSTSAPGTGIPGAATGSGDMLGGAIQGIEGMFGGGKKE